MDQKWFTRRMQEPVENRDCNNCKWLSLTEEEQRQRASQGLPVVNIPHICEKYNKRVYHRYADRFLYPCNKCVMDGFCYFAERHYDIQIGINHAEFCAHKLLYYQETGESLSCKECPRTKCQFHGCSI